jgi:hypothetical protein
MMPEPIAPPKAVVKKKQAPAQNPGVSFNNEIDINDAKTIEKFIKDWK